MCTCCNERNISHDKCVIFVKKNYNFGKSEVSNALRRRYREKNNKDFICKECHTKLQNIDTNTKFYVNTKTIQKKIYIKEQNVVNQVIITDTSETIQQKCICMFCMKQHVPNSNCVKFDKLKYDTNNYWMQELIQKNEHLDIDANFICMKCDSYLKTGNIPVQLFTICDINVNKCFFW